LKQVVVLADAAEDLEAARNFYDAQEPGVGEYCVDSLFADIVSLGFFSGIHPLHFEFHRMFRANKNWNASSTLNSQPSTLRA